MITNSSRAEIYYEIFKNSPDKMQAAKRILENFLVEIKNTLKTQKVSSLEDHGNVLLVYNSEWIKFANYINMKEKRAVMRHDGLFRALLKLFPNEMEAVSQANSSVSELLIKFNLNPNPKS